MKEIREIEIEIYGEFNGMNPVVLGNLVEELNSSNTKDGFVYNSHKLGEKSIIEINNVKGISEASFAIDVDKIKISMRFRNDNPLEKEEKINITIDLFNELLRGSKIQDYINDVKCKIKYELLNVKKGNSHLINKINNSCIVFTIRIDVNDNSFTITTETKTDNFNFNDVDACFAEALRAGILYADAYIEQNKNI